MEHHKNALLFKKLAYDALTGLPGKLLLHDRMHQATSHTDKTGLDVGIMLINIDDFKYINDTFGHDFGDETLKTVSQKLSQYIYRAETAGKLEGDEFILILPRIRTEVLVIKANELLNLISTPLLIRDSFINISASIGISLYPKDGRNIEVLIDNARHALHQSRRISQNGFQFYASEFSEYLKTREQLIIDLKTALQESQFLLYYQPVINVKTGKIAGVEALLRWQHPNRGLLFPSEFLDVIEESGLMPDIGAWVLKTACTQAKVWQKKINPYLFISINIASTQFLKRSFVSQVKNILKETQANPHLIEFEITETLLVHSPKIVIEKMCALRELGIKFSMDDFGTGYATLSWLKSFPFDKVKIHQSLVTGAMNNRVDQSIIEAVILMSQRMGMLVVAEGVSTAEELQFLQANAALECQGFYISPAIQKDDCERFLLSQQSLK